MDASRLLLALFGALSLLSLGMLIMSFHATEGKFVYWDTWSRAEGGEYSYHAEQGCDNLPIRHAYKECVLKKLKANSDNAEKQILQRGYP